MPKLCALLVQMTSLEAQRPRRLASCCGDGASARRRWFRARTVPRAQPARRRRRRIAEPADACGSASRTVSSSTTPISQQQQSLDAVAQLAHVARPRIAVRAAPIAPGVNGFGFQPFCSLIARAKCSTRAGISPAAFAQRRQHDREHDRCDDNRSCRNPPLRPPALRDCDASPPPRARPRASAGSAHALDLAFLQHAQQLGLHHRRHVADFIQKQRAAMGLFEFADVPRRRAGEGSFLVAEQLGFDQLAAAPRRSSAPRRTARAVGSFREPRARPAPFPCPSRPGCRRAIRRRPRAPPAPSPAASRRWPRRSRAADALPQFAILALPGAARRSAFSTVSSSFSVESGFSRKSSAPSSRRPHRHVERRLAGDHHHRRGHPQRAHFPQQRDAVLVRHHDVGKNQIERLRANQLERARGVIGDRRLVAGHAKRARQRGQRIRIVVDNQQAAHAFSSDAGRSMVNVAPRPGSLADRDPAVMIADHALHDGQAQPRAVLLGRVVRREQARALFFGVRPWPESVMAMRTHVRSPRSVRTRSVPPSGIASIAFNTRLPQCAAQADRDRRRSAVRRRPVPARARSRGVPSA